MTRLHLVVFGILMVGAILVDAIWRNHHVDQALERLDHLLAEMDAQLAEMDGPGP